MVKETSFRKKWKCANAVDSAHKRVFWYKDPFAKIIRISYHVKEKRLFLERWGFRNFKHAKDSRRWGVIKEIDCPDIEDPEEMDEYVRDTLLCDIELEDVHCFSFLYFSFGDLYFFFAKECRPHFFVLYFSS